MRGILEGMGASGARQRRQLQVFDIRGIRPAVAERKARLSGSRRARAGRSRVGSFGIAARKSDFAERQPRVALRVFAYPAPLLKDAA